MVIFGGLADASAAFKALKVTCIPSRADFVCTAFISAVAKDVLFVQVTKN